MNNVNQRPVTVPTEQAAIQAMVESDNKGFEPQVSVAPDSNMPKKLDKGQIFSVLVLLGMNYNFGRIKINRDIDIKQVNKKIQSIDTCGGIISPFLAVPAEDCLNAGLELESFDGHTITKDTPNLEYVLIILDGQHRFTALKQLNKRRLKSGKPEYDGYCYLPLIDNYDVPTLLREANSATNPWDGMDWVTQLLVTAQNKRVSTDKLEWIKEKAKSGSDSAAWAWVNEGKTTSKAMCINASKDESKLKNLADITSFEEDKKLYEAASKSFKDDANKVLGWKVLPEWVFDKINRLVKEDVKRSEAISLLTAFLEGIEYDTALDIRKTKKSESQSKDNMIIAKLNKLYAAFNASR